MRFGLKREEGMLPVFSVDTEEQAKALLVAACGRNMEGEFYAKELVEEQSLENLQAFSDRLAETWERIKDRVS